MKNQRRFLAVGLLLFFSLAHPTNTIATGFPAVQNFPVGTAPVAVAIGDFNGDNKPDLAVANSGSANVSILLGNGDGTFQPAVNYFAGPLPSSVVVGDFNGDGKLDLAVANRVFPDGSVSILLGNGDGTFRPALNFAVGPSPSSIAVGDFNGDQKTDLAVANFGDPSICGNGNVSILLGNGDGTFRPALNTGTVICPLTVAVGDFNGDTRTDLVTSNGSNLGIMLGNGDGTFQPPVSFAVGRTLSLSIVVADFNRDGKLDLAATSSTMDFSSATRVLLGNGDGTFRAAVTVDTSFDVFVSSGDLNGDGIPDLAVLSGVESALLALRVKLGNGDGTFQPALVINLATHPRSLALGDLNGDGTVDVVITNDIANSISVLLNRGFTLGVTKSGNGTGTVTSSPAGINCGSTCSASFDGGTMVTLTATANGLSIFEGWSGACTGMGACFVNMDADKTVEATFAAAPMFALTVNTAGAGSGTITSSPSGINCGLTCVANFFPGTVVTLTPTASAGSSFAGWSGACSGNAACVVTIDADKSVTATFNALPDFSFAPPPAHPPIVAGGAADFTLTLNSSGGFSGTVTVACTAGMPPNSTCIPSPGSLALSSASPSGITTVRVQTRAASAIAKPSPWSRGPSNVPAMGLLLAAVFTALLAAKQKISRWTLAASRFCLVLIAPLVIAGCSGTATTGAPSMPGTPPGKYIITVSATSGGITHTTTLALTVQ